MTSAGVASVHGSGGHDGAPRLLDALPPVVAVHGVVAARDAADFGDARVVGQLGQHAFQLVQIARAASRRHVSAVHEAVHHDMRRPGRLRGARERVEVLVGGMDAAVGDEPHKVQRRPGRAAAANASFSTGFAASEPSAQARLMRVSSWNTTRPAPMLRCPTSELPICPAGRPTASPDASSLVHGRVANTSSRHGVRA